MRSSMLISLYFVCFAALGGARAQAPEQARPALQAEMQWVHLIDAGDYAAAWASSAKMMQTALPEPEFAKSMSGARTPLGALGTRMLKSTQVTAQLPGAPDGQYVVAQYTTLFAKKAEAIETLIAAEGPDGSWHVAGYFIR